MGFSLKSLISPISSLINPTKLINPVLSPILGNKNIQGSLSTLANPMLGGMLGGVLGKQLLGGGGQQQPQQAQQQQPQMQQAPQFGRQWTMPYGGGGYGMPMNGMMQPFQGGWNSQFGGGRSMMPQQLMRFDPRQQLMRFDPRQQPMRFDPRQYMQQQQQQSMMQPWMRGMQQMPQQNPWMAQGPYGMFGGIRTQRF